MFYKELIQLSRKYQKSGTSNCEIIATLQRLSFAVIDEEKQTAIKEMLKNEVGFDEN